MVYKDKGKKSLQVWAPRDLVATFHSLCIKKGISMTEGIVQYFEYLEKQHNQTRKHLNEDSDVTKFNLKGKCNRDVDGRPPTQ